METGFGWIVIGRDRFEHDVVIHADGKVTKRKKKDSRTLKKTYGHTSLSDGELGFLSDEHPEVVYIGSGQYGDLPVTAEALATLAPYGPVIRRTPEILPLLMKEKRRYAAIIHVTC